MSEARTTQSAKSSNGNGAANAFDQGYHADAKIATGDTIDVRQFNVTEPMSALFEVKLVVVSENPDIDFEAAIGQPMTFTLHGDPRGDWRASRERTWAGICRDLRQVRVEESHLSTYEITLVPALWLTTQRRNHRIFQVMTEIDIVLQILGEWGIEPTQRLAGQYPKRKYRVQYGESDFAFVSRLLEEAGIAYRFAWNPERGTSLVLTDEPQRREPRAGGAIPFVAEPNGRPTTPLVTKVSASREIKPGAVTIRELVRNALRMRPERIVVDKRDGS